MQRNVFFINNDHAKKYGFEATALLGHIVYWIGRNKSNGKNLYDGRTWTYQSLKAFTEMFPFWSRRQIERMLERLKAEGVLITGNYNNSAYDRTVWYALKDENAFLETEKSISPNREIEKTEQGNVIYSITEDITEDNQEEQPKTPTPLKEINPEYRKCSELLKKRILEFKQQKITDETISKWDDTVRLMVERDGSPETPRTVELIVALINECHDMQPHPRTGFTWRKNILSMEKLRQQWNDGKIWIGMTKRDDTVFTGTTEVRLS